MTVNQLIAALTQLKKDGYGHARVLLATDDEGNSFRDCIYAPSEWTFESEEEFNSLKEMHMLPENASFEEQIITLG